MCLHIEEEGAIPLQSDYPYSLCDQFLTCYPLKSGAIVILLVFKNCFCIKCPRKGWAEVEGG